MNRSILALAAASLALAACGGDGKKSTGSGILGPPTLTQTSQCTGALAGLTYANFARAFLGTGGSVPANQGFCTGCHDTGKAGVARSGAPSDHNFESLTVIKSDPDMLGHIDRVAGMNPNGSVANRIMPPASAAAVPLDLDRQKLSCWIAAGAPQ